MTANTTGWQTQFQGAVRWSTLGIVDDGVTDNTDALNALPTNVPIIADAPNGGTVLFDGTWYWKSGLTIWQTSTCKLVSTMTTAGIYPIESDGGFTSLTAVENIQYYGMNFSFSTPTQGVRMLRLFVNHFKFKYFKLDGSGGFAFIRGSDQEIAYGTMTNTIKAAGNPGVRHFGNLPKVTTSPGMRANVWIHNLRIQCGDGAFQVGQPITNALTWGYGPYTGTDDLLYEDCYADTTSALILVGLINDYGGKGHHPCQNVTFRNVNGTGRWHFLCNPGGPDGTVRGITIDGSHFSGANSDSALSSVSIGNIVHGGTLQTGANMSDILLKNVVHVDSLYPLQIVGPFANISVSNSIFAQRLGPSRIGPAIVLDGTNNVVFQSVNVRGNLDNGVSLSGNLNSNFVYNTGKIGNIVSNRAGVDLGHSTGTSINAVSVAAANATVSNTAGFLISGTNTTNSSIANVSVSKTMAVTKAV